MSKSKKTQPIEFVGYVLVKCKPLLDQWECEFDRMPLSFSITYPNTPKTKRGKFTYCFYEVYGVRKDGRLIKVQEVHY